MKPVVTFAVVLLSGGVAIGRGHAAQPSGEPSAAAVARDPDDVNGPWRLSSALELPEWLEIGGEQRTRYEYLNSRFRIGASGSDQGLYLRTSVKLTIRPGIPQATIEVMDARQYLADDGSLLGTSQVNAAEVIQAFAALNFEDVIADDDTVFVQGGRFTMDVGSRRLVARNRFRNTVNTFTGLNARWKHASGSSLQAFWTLPIERLPRDRASLLDNDIEFDDEDLDLQFWGVVGSIPKLVEAVDVEAYVFGLHEEDDGDTATRDRELYTVGTRIGKRPKVGKFDFEIESVVQFGSSRASTATSDTRDLDHLAFFHHAEIGYSFDVESELRVAIEFDYATGDDDPADGDNGRFDTLFGARRFDFGPTGAFGPFARSNLISPGVRLAFNPAKDWQIMLVHRFYWLEDATDSFVAGRLRDPSGSSGSFLGNMPEISVRWDAIPGNLRLEAGAAYLFKGDFFDDVPESPGSQDIAYLYFQSTLTF